MNYLGYSWTEQGRHLQRAKKMIRKAAELRPRDGYIVDSLGWIHYQQGAFKAAVTHLERAVELRPADPVINDHLGTLIGAPAAARKRATSGGASCCWRRARNYAALWNVN